MTTGINGYYNYPQNYYNNYQTQPATITKTGDNTISFQGNRKAETKLNKDDGKIGIFGALKNLVKGGVKFFTGMFTDENGNFSIGQTLKTAAIAAAVGATCILTAGTAVPAIIAAAGVGISGLGMAKSAYDIVTADTDAEAEAAWQSLGSNTVATGLAITGAKAVAKSNAAAAGESVEQFNGIDGAAKAVKSVFKTSKDAVASNFKGVSYNSNAGIIENLKTAKDTVSENFKANKTAFKDQVSKNFNETIYGTNAKIANDVKEMKKEEASLKKEMKGMDKKSDAYKAKQTKLDELQAKREGVEQINKATSYEEGYKTVKENETKLASLKENLTKATTDAQKDKINAQISQLESKVNAQKGALSRRTSEAQALRDQLQTKTKELEAANKAKKPDTEKIAKLQDEIATLKTKQGFLPNSNQLEVQLKAEEAFLKRISETENPNPKVKAEIENRNNIIAEINDKISAAKGGGYRQHVTNEFGRQIIANNKNYKNDPTAWLTVGITGRQFGSTPEARFFSQLNSEERQYFNSLPKAQQEQILSTYSNAVA